MKAVTTNTRWAGKALLSRSAVVLTVIVAALFAAPAQSQVLLLNTEQSVPLVAVLDNPCTPSVEAIAFSGGVTLTEKVWQMPSGNIRLVITSRSAATGQSTAAVLPGAPNPTYAFGGKGHIDAEFASRSFEMLSYHKVTSSTGANDNFHAVVALAFDPGTLKLSASVETDCASAVP